MPSLSLFPARCAIGTVKQPDGTEVEVFMTPEFFRAMSDLLERVGGENGLGNDELAELGLLKPEVTTLMDLQRQVAELKQVITKATQTMTATRNSYAEIRYLFTAPKVDWGRPGKIGLWRPSSIRATTLQVSGAATFATASYTGQVTSTVAGVPPFIVASAFKVVNLYADRAALADTATILTVPTAFPANATDLPTVITLANALKAAGIAKGL